MLVLCNVRIIPSKLRKNKGTTECDKSIITYDVGTTQCEVGTINVRKKIREPPNLTKIQLHVMLVLHFEIGSIKCKEKNKGTIEYDKNIVTCDVSILQCEDSIIKCEKKGTTEYDKSIVTYDVGTVQYENNTIKCEKKIKVPPNVIKYSYM